MKPLAIDLFAGSFGWSQGWLELGGRVIGFDIEHEPHHGPVPRGADLVLQDVRTINGAQFKDASLILASPPCQEFSYMAMPWTRAKKIAAEYRDGTRQRTKLTELFDACFRIQREAIVAAGHFIPLVVENVRGAQPWVGRSRWSYGSYHLWGDVPALMPITAKGRKVSMASWRHPSDPRHVRGQGFNTLADRQTREMTEGVKIGGAAGDDWFMHHNRPEFEARATKNDGGSWFNVAHNTTSGKGQNPDGRKTESHVNQRDGYDHTRHLTNQEESDAVKIGGERFHERRERSMRKHSSKSSARKAASARIARIPLPLARHIARTYFPAEMLRAGEGRR